MDPASIVYLLFSAGTTIAAQEKSKWSRAGWHGLTFDEKKAMVNLLLAYSYEQLPKQNKTVFNIFFEQLLPYITRPNETTFSGWIALNEWILSDPQLVPYYQAKYQLGPFDTPTEDQLKFIRSVIIKDKATAIVKNPIFYISAIILIILTIAVIVRARK